MAQLQAVYPQPEIPTFEPFVDEHEVARFLHLTPRRVLELARKGELPAHPLGNVRKTWRFRLSEIEGYFDPRQERERNATISMAVPGTKERNRLG